MRGKYIEGDHNEDGWMGFKKDMVKSGMEWQAL